MAEAWTTLRVLDWTTDRFAKAGMESSRLEAQILLAHVLGCDRVSLYTKFDRPLGEDELARFRSLIRKRLDGQPVAYLVGEKEFWSLPFAVDGRVLIPRADTETLVELVLDSTADRGASMHVLDIATGSGALAITLAHELSAARVVATDLSAGALEVARQNAVTNGVADRVEFRCGDLLAPIGANEQFDVIVSNPPYVRSADIDALAVEVRCEPRQALDGGKDGLDLIRRLVREVPRRLAPHGLLAVEHGYDQAAAVAAVFVATGKFTEPGLRCDLGRRPRVTFARGR